MRWAWRTRSRRSRMIPTFSYRRASGNMIYYFCVAGFVVVVRCCLLERDGRMCDGALSERHGGEGDIDVGMSSSFMSWWQSCHEGFYALSVEDTVPSTLARHSIKAYKRHRYSTCTFPIGSVWDLGGVSPLPP